MFSKENEYKTEETRSFKREEMCLISPVTIIFSV